MNKRYQIFLSSTYSDLIDERRKVIEKLIELDCIPAGMELFPATDEDQFNYIKKVIDDCDYYLIIIGGRYGSLTSEGLSFTEREYEYACEIGTPVIALLHGDPDAIPVGKTDKSDELARQLEAFRERLEEGRLVRYWSNMEELLSNVILSLTKAFSSNPAIGWVRADRVGSEELLSQVNTLYQENEDLRKQMRAAEVQSRAPIEDLADLDETFEVRGSYSSAVGGRPLRKSDYSKFATWRELFALIAPRLLQIPDDQAVKARISSWLFSDLNKSTTRYHRVDPIDFDTIKVQLRAQGLVSLEYLSTQAGGMALFWKLTPKGEQLMLEACTVKTSKNGDT